MKKKLIAKLTAAFLACAAMLTVSTTVYSGGTDATVHSYEDQIANIQWKIQQALTELNSIESDMSYQYSEMEKLDEIIQLNTQQKNIIANQLTTIEKQIAEKTLSIQETGETLEKQEQAFRDRLVQVYMEEEVDYLELLLGSTSLVDFLTRMDTFNAILEYDTELIKDLNTQKAILEADQAILDEALEKQVARADEYQIAINTNQEAYARKEAYVKQLETDEAAWIAEYARQKELEDELNAELEAYLAELAWKEEQERIRKEQELAAQQAAQQQAAQQAAQQQAAQQAAQQQAQSSGTHLPVDPGSGWYVSSWFGWRDLYGVKDYHLGIDLACPNGTNVHAFKSGEVIKSEYHWSYGNYILINHGNGFATLYAHMSERLYSVGDYVNCGDVIGYVGLTGTTFGYHLHFETRENGSVVDPVNYLSSYIYG